MKWPDSIIEIGDFVLIKDVIYRVDAIDCTFYGGDEGIASRARANNQWHLQKHLKKVKVTFETGSEPVEK